jgi:cytochrome c556
MRIVLLAAGLAFAGLPAFAQEDPIETRQYLMRANGAAAATAGMMLRGDLEYAPAVGRSAIMTMRAVSHSFGDYLPEGSHDPERSDAEAAIWEDMEGFQAVLAEFRELADAAVEAAGEEGPADREAFAAAVQPVLGQCRDCHQSYRAER